jgi:hypothetical protein
VTACPLPVHKPLGSNMQLRLDYASLGLKIVPWVIDCGNTLSGVHWVEIAAVPGLKKVRVACGLSPVVERVQVHVWGPKPHRFKCTSWIGRERLKFASRRAQLSGWWQVISTGGLEDFQPYQQQLEVSVATVGEGSAELAERLGGSGVVVDLLTLEKTDSRTPVDLHVHLHTEPADADMDITMVLPICVGLAAVALGRKIKPGVAVMGNSPFSHVAARVAPVGGSVLSESAVQACVEKGIHTVIGGKHVHDGGQGMAAQADTGAVTYIGVENLFEAIQAATV